jgi:DNA polymerase-3 subunit alpha
MPDFVHLHNHSEYSLLDGLSKTKEMVARAAELGMKAIAITDHGSLYGAIKFFKACKEKEIKPIIGCEVYVAKRSLHDKEAEHDKDYNHLILLAKNEQGYKNLMKLVSIAYLEGFYYKPRVDLALLKNYSEGIICLSACLNGYITDPLMHDQQDVAEDRLQKLSKIFGPDHFYLELQRHPNLPQQDQANEKLLDLSKRFGVPVVATNDNHYILKEDAEAQEILLCIQTQTTIETKNRKMSMLDSPGFYIKSPEEMAKEFADIPQAVENSVKIADMCNLEITLGKWIMPVFDVPSGKTPGQYLRELTEEGLKTRYKEITKQITERMEYELSIILKKGYETYFLVVADFVNWAKKNGISVGPGRGSAAGSLVSYALSVTDVDPFYFNLPFERFLNPYRPSAPDIDLDFADIRRDEVIAYVTQKYGSDKVAQIVTFGTMEARGAVRDAGRALGMPYAGPDRISKMIPPGWQGHAMTIDSALSQSPELKRAYESEPDTKRLLEVAKKLEGVARHASVHAAGVVIADKPLTEYTPLQRESNGDRIVTQYDMYTVGEDGVGLLKMDFLGLRNLTIIEEALKFIKEKRGEDIDLTKVPLDDKKTYDLLAQAETTGIFQLESSGMRRYIKDLRPSNIFDLMAMVALYRPGPMQNIPEFIARKHNPALISYPDPRLTEILKTSYGILTYQDDVLLTTIVIAGYDWLEADKFRKAMGKKIPSEMKKQREAFINGAVKNGLTITKAESLFELIAPFAGYGFNKAHAACYATIAFRTAYLKANYSVEFMTALLTAESRGTTGPAKNEKIAQAVAECKRLQIPVLPPDINKSGSEFTIENDTSIRFGLSAIKNVGAAAIESILSARQNGPFISLEEFCSRVDLSKVNKKTLESLIKAGGFDQFGKRASLLMLLQEVLNESHRKKKEQKDSQASLFGDDTVDEEIAFETLPDSIEDFTPKEKLAFEKEFLGIYLTSHPQKEHMNYVKTMITHNLDVLTEEKDGTQVKIGGIVESSRVIITKKKGEEMAFLVLGDEHGLIVECVVFPKTFALYKHLLIKDRVILVDGHLDTKNERPAIIVERIYPTASFTSDV